MTEPLKEITLGDMGRFKIGEQSNALYFDNERVHTATMVVLSPGQGFWAICVALFTAIAAIAACVSAYAALNPKPTTPVRVEAVNVVCTQTVEVDNHRRVQRIVGNACERQPG
ncbi:MAG: hypothetical protein J0M19_07185 [Sphingomonadales bacterium]|nr:hypothetical protein [Sphingomonadales bacterium]